MIKHSNLKTFFTLSRQLQNTKLVLFLLPLLASACSPYVNPIRDNNQYRCLPGEPSDPRVGYSLEEPAFKDIHLTAQGAMVDRCQWTDLMLQLEDPGRDGNQSKIIVMHIHGWKHNSDPEDSERLRFQRTINEIHRDTQAAGRNDQVIGIFVAWPGLVWNVAGMQNLTFFSRTAVADQISQSAIVGKLIGAIESEISRRKSQGSNDVFIMMGYSLGARILFNATSQAALYQTQLAKPVRGESNYGIVDGPGDLVMLLNPALSAGNYTAIDSIRDSDTRFSSEQKPIMLTISTSNDTVTKYAYPWGHIVRLRSSVAQRTAIGEFPDYITHSLERRTGGIPPDANAAWYDSFCAGEICLERLPALEDAADEGLLSPRPRQNSNPFIVAKTTPEIINGHGGFWNSDVFSNFLTGFITRTLIDAKTNNQ